MAQISFRQGIVRIQSNALSFNGSNTAIRLDSSSEPLILALADGPDDDYLWEENQPIFEAWGSSNSNISFGPLPGTSPYWLYVDVDALTGQRKFGTTIRDPISQSSAPTNALSDQHWFDTRSISTDGTHQTMKVWDGIRWTQRIRVFVGRVDGTLITQFTIGSQVGFTDKVRAGQILYDDDNKTKPIKRFDRRGRGKFITTESTIFSQFSNISGFRVAQSLIEGKAIENIPQYHAITLRGEREIGLAKNGENQTLLDPGPYEAIGVSTEDINTLEVRTFITHGYLTDDNFIFTDSPGTKIFVGRNGELVTTPPQVVSIQEIGIVVDPFTIFINIQPIVYYTVPSANLVPISLDKETGDRIARGTGATTARGYLHEQLSLSDTWTINHNKVNDKVIVQIYDEIGELVLPDEVVIVDINNIEIRFAAPMEGTAHIIFFSS